LIDGQLERASACRWAFEPAERLPPRIGLHPNGTRLAAYDFVVGRFDSAKADIVGADVANEMSRKFSIRIEATAFLDEPDPFEIECRHASRFVGRHTALHVDEGAF
jgi:hypothetical protein